MIRKFYEFQYDGGGGINYEQLYREACKEKQSKDREISQLKADKEELVEGLRYAKNVVGVNKSQEYFEQLIQKHKK